MSSTKITKARYKKFGKDRATEVQHGRVPIIGKRGHEDKARWERWEDFLSLNWQRVLLTNFRLEFDKLFGNLVVTSLWEDAEDCPSRFVHLDSLAHRQPVGGRSLQKTEIFQTVFTSTLVARLHSKDEQTAGLYLQLCKKRHLRVRVI